MVSAERQVSAREPDSQDAWPIVSDHVRQAVDGGSHRLWFERLGPAVLRGATLSISAPETALGWLEQRYGQLIADSAKATLGDHVSTQFVSDAPTAPRQPKSQVADRKPSAAQTSEPRTTNPRFCFEEFVIGRGNRLAHGAALSVAEQPGAVYNPLFLCGPPGLGKTHLLHSIANYLEQNSPDRSVLYTTAEEFTNGFLGSLRGDTASVFKSAHRSLDVLLVDDVQFLANKKRTEEEFFHTFNHLVESGKQLVLTSDRPPSELGSLAERLRDRFGSGLVAELQPPDFNTRLAVLRKRALADGIMLSDPSVLRTIAERVTDNIRTLEGTLIRAVAFGSLTGRSLDGELVREVLDKLAPPPKRTGADVELIKEATCEEFGITLAELDSRSRTARVALARQIAMYLTREINATSLPEIGAEFGGRNHTTVMHALQRTDQRLSENADLRSRVDSIAHKLTGTRT